MSPLRSPWVTGLLAAAAVGVVGYQILGPQLLSHSSAPPRQTPVAATRPEPPAASTAATIAADRNVRAPQPGHLAPTEAKPAESPEPGMDRGFLESRFATWVNAPARDPFLLVMPEAGHPHPVLTNSPVATWKLSGIWNQEGVRLAVINHRVYGEGDEIEGYRIERIVGDEVWFLGTNGVERLGIQQHRSLGPKGQPKPPASK